MRSALALRTLAALIVIASVMTFGVLGAQSALGQHGIAFVKGCDSPAPIGSPYACSYQIQNAVDTVHDTLQITGLSDQVHAASGDVNSGNVLGSLQLIFTGPVVCIGGSGAGTVASPYVGATSCTLPFGSSILTNDFSFYTVQPGDFGLANHKLTDTATLSWFDTCDIGATPPSNCSTTPQTATAGSSADVLQLATSTATDIHNGQHQTVTTVAAGTQVHDFVTVSGQPGSPNPTGNVVLAWFTNNTCSAPAAQTSGNIALAAGGTVDATTFPQTPATAGFFGFRATYLGDATYTASTGPCEPLRVVDANIQLTPGTATNPIGTNHVLTCHVNVNDGNGVANAPAGTVCTVNILSGSGTPATQNCTTVGTTGSCTVTITSSTPGTSTLQATTTVSVGGVSLTRTTGDANAGDGPNATKVWADDVVTTAVRDAANSDVTNQTVPSGTVVHDEATVAKTANTPAAAPAPTGTVTFTLYDNGTCNGSVVATDANKALNASGVATSATFTTPTAGGVFSYLAHYSGDANYPAHDAPCEPFQVNAVEGGGRITGGGSIFDTVEGVPNTRITHGFQLRCDPNDTRQSLEINWAGGNNFHLQKLINSVVCFDDPTTAPPPPPGTVFDTYAGNTLFEGHAGYHGFGYAVGTGICNKIPATIYFILIDAGEPGTADIAEYHITGGCTLNVGPKLLTFGNHQFHKR